MVSFFAIFALGQAAPIGPVPVRELGPPLDSCPSGRDSVAMYDILDYETDVPMRNLVVGETAPCRHLIESDARSSVLLLLDDRTQGWVSSIEGQEFVAPLYVVRPNEYHLQLCPFLAPNEQSGRQCTATVLGVSGSPRVSIGEVGITFRRVPLAERKPDSGQQICCPPCKPITTATFYAAADSVGEPTNSIVYSWRLLQLQPRSAHDLLGLRVGDEVIEIDGKQVGQLGRRETMAALCGGVRSVVTVSRGEQRFDLEYGRDR